jgi:AcrR family transcriptional regulator
VTRPRRPRPRPAARRRTAERAAPERTPERTPERAPERATDRETGAPERKSDATRRKLLERALALFQQRGVEGTTMRDIARAAGLSLGAAYYYFPSKEALLFAYYDANQTLLEAEAAHASGSVRERLGADFHLKLSSVQPQRRMLAAIVSRLVDPGDPLSALSAQQRAVRERAVALLARVLDGAGLSADTVRLAAGALWLLQMGALLLYVHDESPDQARTHRLVDDALDLIVPMLPVFDTPFGREIGRRIVTALDRAGIALPGNPGVL